MADDQQYVKLPDGTYGSFPSGMKDEEITSAIQKNFPSNPTPMPGDPNAIPKSVPEALKGPNQSNVERVTTGPPLTGLESGLSSPAQVPENAKKMQWGAIAGGMLTNPLTTIGALGGGAVGGGLGRVGAQFAGLGDRGQDIAEGAGNLIGGAIGGGLGKIGQSPRAVGRAILLDPVTGKPTLSPGSVAERVLRTPEEAQDALLNKKGEEFDSARKLDEQKRGEQVELGKAVPASESPGPYRGPASIPKPVEEPLFSKVSEGPGPYTGPKSVPKPVPELGSVENPGLMSKIPTRMPRPAVQPISESPYATQNEAAKSFAEGKEGPNVPLVKSPVPQPEAPMTSAFGNSGKVPYGSVIKLPVPNEALPPINPKYMASVPRASLMGMGESRTPGAGTQLGQIGNKIVYLPEGGYAPPKSTTLFPEAVAERTRLGNIGGPSNPQIAQNPSYRVGEKPAIKEIEKVKPTKKAKETEEK